MIIKLSSFEEKKRWAKRPGFEPPRRFASVFDLKTPGGRQLSCFRFRVTKPGLLPQDSRQLPNTSTIDQQTYLAVTNVAVLSIY